MPLHAAVSRGHTAMAMALLDRGADIHARDRRGATPLRLANSNGHTSTAQALIARGASESMSVRSRAPA